MENELDIRAAQRKVLTRNLVLAQENYDLRQRVATLELALQFYANEANYVQEWNGQGFTIIDFDEGATAQAALKA